MMNSSMFDFVGKQFPLRFCISCLGYFVNFHIEGHITFSSVCLYVEVPVDLAGPV